MHPSIRQRRTKHKKGDTIIDNLTKIRKCYDGNKWRRLCSVQLCNKKAQVHGVCMRHSRKYELELNDNQHVQSIKPELTDNSFASTSQQNDFHNQDFDTDSKEHLVLPNTISPLHQTEFLNSINFDPSSVSNRSTNVFPDTLINTGTRQNTTMEMKICGYSTLSNSTLPCRNLGHYKCSHCSVSFCLEHDLQHQQELKGEVYNLLNEAKTIYKSIDQLTMNTGSWLCSMRLDQWATQMHMKIDQTRTQLQAKLHLLDGQIEANKDRWKVSLQTDIETKVGCVLMELLQKFEIDGIRLNNAHENMSSLRTAFNACNQEQLISIVDYEEEKMNFDLPQLSFPSFILNDPRCTRDLSPKNSEGSNYSSDDSRNSFKDHSIHQMEAYNQFNGYLNTTCDLTEISKDIDCANGKTPTLGIPTTTTPTTFLQTTASSTKIVSEDHRSKQQNCLLNQLESDLLTDYEPSRKFEYRSLPSVEDSELIGTGMLTSSALSSPPISTLTTHNNHIADDMSEQYMDPAAGTEKILQISTTLDLSNSEIGDKEALYLSEVFQNNDIPITLNLACNQIGKQGALCLSNILRNNKNLTTLVLQSNHIGNQGLEYLSAALRDNTTLTTLDLSSNQIDNHGMRYLCNALSGNRTLTTLNLERNQIGEEGARYLSDVLRSNTTLTTLQLRWNRLGENGTQYLSDALQYNKTLIELNISYNQIGNAGARYLSEALKYNTILKTLELRCNQIDDEGVEHLCKTLSNNQTLNILNLLGNEIGIQGAEQLIGLRNKNTRLRVHRK